jgi:hypothetical protein
MNRLDHFTRHVENIQRAIGRMDAINGSKPGVARLHQLGVLVGPARVEANAVGHDLAPMDEIVL